MKKKKKLIALIDRVLQNVQKYPEKGFAIVFNRSNQTLTLCFLYLLVMLTDNKFIL